MKNRTSVLISIMVATLMVSMDSTIMNTTMPVIVKDLGDKHLYPWIFSGYMIFSTVLVSVAGSLSDIFGRKKIFVGGILLFFLGSFLCGLSQTMGQLVLFRIVQGIGAGFVLPFPNIIAGDLYKLEHRGRIQALLGAMWSLSTILAPVLGSIIIKYTSWQWIFYINLPICFACFILLIPYQEEFKAKKAKIDYIGTLLFASGISLILLPTINIDLMVYAMAGIFVLVSFYFYERKQTSALIPITLVKRSIITWMSVNGFVAWLALFGSSVYIPLILQEQGHSVLISGVVLLGSAMGWMVVSVPSGRLILRYGYRPLFLIGNALLLLHGLMVFTLKQDTSFAFIFLAMIAHGLSFGLLYTIAIIGSQQLVPPSERGISTSFQMMTRNIGTAIGVAIMGAFLVNPADFYSGVHHLFLFSLIGAGVAGLTCLFIPKTWTDFSFSSES